MISEGIGVSIESVKEASIPTLLSSGFNSDIGLIKRLEHGLIVQLSSGSEISLLKQAYTVLQAMTGVNESLYLEVTKMVDCLNSLGVAQVSEPSKEICSGISESIGDRFNISNSQTSMVFKDLSMSIGLQDSVSCVKEVGADTSYELGHDCTLNIRKTSQTSLEAIAGDVVISEHTKSITSAKSLSGGVQWLLGACEKTTLIGASDSTGIQIDSGVAVSRFDHLSFTLLPTIEVVSDGITSTDTSVSIGSGVSLEAVKNTIADASTTLGCIGQVMSIKKSRVVVTLLQGIGLGADYTKLQLFKIRKITLVAAKKPVHVLTGIKGNTFKLSGVKKNIRMEVQYND